MTTTAVEISSTVADTIGMASHQELNTLFGELPALIGGIYAQNTSKEFADILDVYSNKGGKISGRSRDNGVRKTVIAKLPEGAESYQRPNGDNYYSRPWGEHEDVSVLRTARGEMQFVLLYGAPGCGKTALVEAAFGEELVTVLGSGDTEVADLVGGYTQTPDGKWAWTDGPLLQAAEAGAPLLIDEVGLIDPKVLSIVYGLMDGRREYTVTANPERGTVKAKDGFYVVGATNPNAPGVRLSEALLSRFTIHVEMTTDWSLAQKLGVPRNIVTASQNLAKKQSSGEVSWAPQFRELLAFRDLEKKFGTKFAISNLLAAAPEMDRPVVSDVFSRIYGEATLPARI